jgi:hypothetical protein
MARFSTADRLTGLISQPLSAGRNFETPDPMSSGRGRISVSPLSFHAHFGRGLQSAFRLALSRLRTSPVEDSPLLRRGCIKRD